MRLNRFRAMRPYSNEWILAVTTEDLNEDRPSRSTRRDAQTVRLDEQREARIREGRPAYLGDPFR